MWYALIGDDQVGPLAPAGMAELRRDGRLDDGTFVWRDGMADWLPLAQVPELRNAMAAAEPDDPEELDDSELRAEEEGATLMMDGEQGKDWASYLDALARQSTPLAAAVSAPLRGPGSVAHATGEQRAVQVAAAAKAEPPAPLPEPASALPDFDLPSIEEAPEPEPIAPVGRSAPVVKRSPAPAPAPEPEPKGRAVEIDFGNMLEPDAEDAGTPAPIPVTLASQASAPAPAGGSRTKVWLILLPLLGATVAAVVLWVQHTQKAHTPGTPPPVASDAPTPATTAPTEPPTQAPTQPPTEPPTAPPTVASAPASVASAAPSVAPSAAVAVASGAPKPPPSAASAAPPPASKPPAPRTAAPATAAPPPAPKTAAPAGGDAATKTLSRNDIMGVVDANRAGIQACGAQQPDLKGTLSVATTIERDGSVSAAQVTTSRFRGSPVGTCIEQKIKALKFPKFGADPIRFNLPLNL